jgi:SAM-dependent methyltransferase
MFLPLRKAKDSMTRRHHSLIRSLSYSLSLNRLYMLTCSSYAEPRFVTHIDDMAIKALTEFYTESFPPSGSGAKLLDVCSSWISHYPEGYSAARISGTGMNEKELQRNSILSDYSVKDLNQDPTLPYPDGEFDVVTNTVSIDYLTKPLEIMREINRYVCSPSARSQARPYLTQPTGVFPRRVLKPGGLAICSFSNRCFPTKAVSVWTSTGDLDHAWIVGSYFFYSGGYAPPQAKEITKKSSFGQKGDPMYVVYARKAENIDM